MVELVDELAEPAPSATVLVEVVGAVGVGSPANVIVTEKEGSRPGHPPPLPPEELDEAVELWSETSLTPS
ncbi:MAG TPA: hypothetical protein VNR42_03955, partial [Solirubrobacteraceae bacterium]|nr:hypothetical protein [Solirubrobacteraceae bacterium]